jgi:hypothetical protein
MGVKRRINRMRDKKSESLPNSVHPLDGCAPEGKSVGAESPELIEKAQSPGGGLKSGPANLPRPLHPGRRLSEEILRLTRAFSERAVTLREVLEVMHGRGYDMLLIFLALPFATPVPLPGLSTPLGAVMAIIGMRLALGQKPWLPARLLDRRLPPKFFPKLLRAAGRLVRILEYFLKPRWVTLVGSRLVRRLIGIMILIAALLLMIPLPIPFSNFFPSCTIALLAAAQLEEDGLVWVMGSCLFMITLVFFGMLGWGGSEFLIWLKQLSQSPE